MMQVQPLKRYRRVRYPDHDSLDHQQLNSIPHRWRHHKAVAFALLATSIASAVAQREDKYVTVGYIKNDSFLTESDAYRIFSSESKKHSVHYVRKGRHIKFTLPSSDGKTKKEVNYAIDGFDPKHGIGYVFVTDADRVALLGKNDTTPLPLLAKEIRKGISKTKYAGRVKVVESQAMIAGGPTEKDLRQEIRQFLKWLKSQGVI